MAGQETSILLVDDHKVLRDGLRALLESEAGLRVDGEAGTGAEAIKMARLLQPDVIVRTSPSMPALWNFAGVVRSALKPAPQSR